MSERREITVLFQGDSITDGGRLKDKSREWDLNHQMGHGYAFIINAVLGAKYPQKYLKFINKGISGNRVSDLYGRWVEDALNIKPDVLSIMVGVNDCGSTIHDQAGSGAERFEKIYQLLIDEMKEVNPNVLVVLCEPFILPVGERKEHWEEWIGVLAPLQEKTRLLAEKNSAVLVPLQKKFEELCAVREASYWLWDGVHPNISGHQIVAEEWMKAVMPHLMLE